MRAITLEELAEICPVTLRTRLELFVESLNAALSEFMIDSFVRQTAFLAQVATESAGFRYVRELADGFAYEPPSNLAAHLGNTQPGDGPRFKGRGLLQITGRKNYGLCASALGLELLEQPELLEEPLNACRSAGWFWTEGAGLNLSRLARAHGLGEGLNLNDLADAGDFEGITLAINGGLNGLKDRQAHLKFAQTALA
jgi:putative chitinase